MDKLSTDRYLKHCKSLEIFWNSLGVLTLFSRSKEKKISNVPKNMSIINLYFFQVKIKQEKKDEDEKEEFKDKPEEEKGRLEMKKEEEENEDVKKNQSAETDGRAGGRAKVDPEMGLLVMTIDGQQKQLSFGPSDLLTTATMMDGDKVRGHVMSQDCRGR